MKIVKIIVCILFGAMFVNAGLNKFFNYIPAPEMTEAQMKIYSALGTIIWLMPLVGTVEIIGGLLFAIPKTRALGAIVILPVMTGILVHHITLEPSGLPIAIVLMLIEIWMIADNWRKYRPMVS